MSELSTVAMLFRSRGQSGNVARLVQSRHQIGSLSLNMRVAMKRLMMKYMIAGYKEQNAQYSSLNMEKISARRRLSDAHENQESVLKVSVLLSDEQTVAASTVDVEVLILELRWKNAGRLPLPCSFSSVRWPQQH